MLRLVALCSIALAACAVRGEVPLSAGGKCSAEGLQRYAGQAATAENGAAILRDSGAKTLRWIPHGSAVTMDFSEQRVNVKLDRQGGIEAVTCG
jgi:hypothetical protein